MLLEENCSLQQLKGNKTPGGDGDWRGGRSMAPSRSNSPPRQGEIEPPFGAPLSRMASRRGSRVARQHSYDDDMKAMSSGSTGAMGMPLGMGGADMGLGIPAMPRR